MDETTAIVIASACEDVLKTVLRLNGRLPPKKRLALHLFIAFKMRDVMIEVARSSGADDDFMERLKAIDF